MPLLPLLLLSCTPSPEKAEDSPALSGTTPAATTAMPVWTAEEAFARLSGIEALPLATDVLLSYFSGMSFGDERCPGSADQMTGITFEGCFAESGVYYQGVADFREESWEEGGSSWHLRSLGSDFEILYPDTLYPDTLYPDGAVFLGGGSLGAVEETSSSGVVTLSSRLQGTWSDSSRSDSLSLGISAILDVTATTDGSDLSFDGGLGLEEQAFSFSHLSFEEACGADPSGTASVRDPSGYWYTLDFGACSSCGTLTFDGAPLGELCVDLSPLRDAAWAGFGL